MKKQYWNPAFVMMPDVTKISTRSEIVETIKNVSNF